MFIGIRLTNLLIVTIIFLAHFFAPEGYLFYQHTMSELAGQGVANAWILTTGFVLGGASYIGFAIYYVQKQNLPKWLFWLTALNGLMTLLLGVFPTSYDELINVDVNETVVIIHRYIAYASNLLTLSSITTHAALSKQKYLKLQHLFFLVFAFVFSGFFILYNQEVRGIFQRLILLTTTLWTLSSYGELVLSRNRSVQQNFARTNR
ncbi:MAG: hypothetical protein RLZZ264_532 [Bacillota bacterium]|jgi:hypothetical membrane protein